MRDFLSSIFRILIYPLVSFRPTYYVGMLLVRLSRKAREFYYTPQSTEEFRTVHIAGQIKMYVDTQSYMGGSIYWSGFHHLNEILCLQRMLKRDMTFVDIGANQGEFSVFAAHQLSEGKVIAFEPVNKTRNLLQRNKDLNQLNNLQIYPYGLSDKEGTFAVYTSDNKDLHHGFHEGLSTLYKTDQRNVFEQEIILYRFDDMFFESLLKVNVVKIDVEGAELSVLKGMINTLTKFRPDLLIEINEETFNAAGYTTGDLANFLKNLEYVPFQIRKGRIHEVSYEALHAWGNYFFSVVS